MCFLSGFIVLHFVFLQSVCMYICIRFYSLVTVECAFLRLFLCFNANIFIISILVSTTTDISLKL